MGFLYTHNVMQWNSGNRMQFFVLLFLLLLLYIYGDETKDASKAHCSSEACKQGRLQCEPETPG